MSLAPLTTWALVSDQPVRRDDDAGADAAAAAPLPWRVSTRTTAGPTVSATVATVSRIGVEQTRSSAAAAAAERIAGLDRIGIEQIGDAMYRAWDSHNGFRGSALMWFPGARFERWCPGRRDTAAVDNDVKLTSGAANRTCQSAISPVSNAPAALLSPSKQDYI